MYNFKLVQGKTTNSFLVENFEVTGTEVVPHKPLHADVACRAMYFGVDNEFNVNEYAERYHLTLVSEYPMGRIHETDGFFTFKGKVKGHLITMSLTTRNESPMMVQINADYLWETSI